jgi:potassium/hydrogen antiporter
MTLSVIILISSLLLIAYFFDFTSKTTKIPTIIMLLFIGWLLNQTLSFLKIEVPNLESLLPILGTIGLIMIVLEGSLELELQASKKKIAIKSFFVALIPIISLSFILAILFHYVGNFSFQNSIINAIPLSIISSAIAIPSTKNISIKNKEFVIYETSLSDIIGVIFFNFVALNDIIDTISVISFLFQIIIMIAVSFISTVGLAYLLRKIDHHIKFVPIILIVLLIYAVSKIFHLPALIFIILFGIFLGNIEEFKHFKFIKKLEPENLHKEAHKFRDMVIEFSFLIRSLFFLLFGFLIKTEEIFNIQSLQWTIIIVATLYMIRIITLKIFRSPLRPLMYIAPRGLITILLFLSISTTQTISIVNKSLIIQLIIITVLIMTVGIMQKQHHE